MSLVIKGLYLFNWIRAVTWDFQQGGMCDQQSLRSACTYGLSDQNHCKSLEYSISGKLLDKHHLDFLSLKGGCTGSSESTPGKIPHCWKSHVTAHMVFYMVHIYHCITFNLFDWIQVKIWPNGSFNTFNSDIQRLILLLILITVIEI